MNSKTNNPLPLVESTDLFAVGDVLNPRDGMPFTRLEGIIWTTIKITQIQANGLYADFHGETPHGEKLRSGSSIKKLMAWTGRDVSSANVRGDGSPDTNTQPTR